MEQRKLNNLQDWKELKRNSWFFSTNKIEEPKQYPCIAVFSISRPTNGAGSYGMQAKQWMEICYIYPNQFKEKESLWKRIKLLLQSLVLP